jgi:hypothetical protein
VGSLSDPVQHPPHLGVTRPVYQLSQMVYKAGMNRLKLRADKACEDRATKAKLKAEAEIKAFYEAMEPLADRGLYEGDYRGYLSELALQILKNEDGLKFRNDGDGVATCWHVTWE